MNPEQEKKLHETHDLVKKIHTAINGDDLGTPGIKHRLAVVEVHVEQSKAKINRERGILVAAGFFWGIIVWLIGKIFH